jgi:hypothetical protein
VRHLARASGESQAARSAPPTWNAHLRTGPAAVAAAFVLGACSGGVVLPLLRGSGALLYTPVGFLTVGLPLLALLVTLALDWRRGTLTAAALWRGALACAVVVGAWPAAAWGIPSRIPLWQLVGLFAPPFAIAVAAGFAGGGMPPTAGRCVRRAAAAYVGLCLSLLLYALVALVAPGTLGPRPAAEPALAMLLPYLVFGAILMGLTVVPVGGLVGGYLRAGRLPPAAGG